MDDDIFNDLLNIIFREFMTESQYRKIIHCVLTNHEEVISKAQYTQIKAVTDADVDFIMELINANCQMARIPDDEEEKPEQAPLKQVQITKIK